MGLKNQNLKEADYKQLILTDDTFLKDLYLSLIEIFVGNSKKTVEALHIILDV